MVQGKESYLLYLNLGFMVYFVLHYLYCLSWMILSILITILWC